MANLGDISKINLPNGNVVNIKDATARSNVALLETMNGAKNLAPYNSGEHTGNAGYWFLHTNCIDIAAGTSVYLVFDYTQTAGQYSLQLTDENGQIISGTASYTTNGTTSGHKATKVTIPSGKTAKGYNSYHNSNATVTVSNFMIIPAEIYDAGFTSYQPYALPNTKITPELIELVDSGAKNICNTGLYLLNPCAVTFTLNSDKSVTLNGTSTVSVAMIPYRFDEVILEPNKQYVCKGTNNSNVHVQVLGYTSDSSYSLLANSDTDVEFNSGNWSKWIIRCWISAKPSSGTQFNNVTIYPMICTKAAWDVSQKYVPYGISNAELTSDVSWTKTKLQFSATAADTYEYTGLSASCPANTLLEIWAIDDNSNSRITAIAVTDSNTSIDTVGAVIGENAEPLTMDAGAQWAREVHCVTPRLYNSVHTYYVWVKRGSTGVNNVTLLTRKIVTQ